MSDEIFSIDTTPSIAQNQSVEEDTGPAPETGPAEDCTPVNAYSMRPAFGEVFPLPTIKMLMNSVVSEKLKGKNYSPTDVAKWVREISDEINSRIKETSVQRFKHVVQVYIGQQLGAGCQYIARCCWDSDSDTHVTEVFTNPNLFCVCTVFGVYQY